MSTSVKKKSSNTPKLYSLETDGFEIIHWTTSNQDSYSGQGMDAKNPINIDNMAILSVERHAQLGKLTWQRRGAFILSLTWSKVEFGKPTGLENRATASYPIKDAVIHQESSHLPQPEQVLHDSDTNLHFKSSEAQPQVKEHTGGKHVFVGVNIWAADGGKAERESGSWRQHPWDDNRKGKGWAKFTMLASRHPLKSATHINKRS